MSIERRNEIEETLARAWRQCFIAMKRSNDAEEKFRFRDIQQRIEDAQDCIRNQRDIDLERMMPRRPSLNQTA